MARTIRNAIDLHCDTIYECDKRGLPLQNNVLHFSLNKLPEGYRLCQAMAAFIPDELRGEAALAHFERLHRLFDFQMEQFRDTISRVSDVTKIEEGLDKTRFAAILTIEGGAALAGRLENIERFFEMGVRMITLTWNGENEICGGAATDSGFTKFGREAVAGMERLGIAVDVSHLSDRGFWQLSGFANKPFLASHSNSRSVCNHRRNLTDDMFREIAARGGIVGLNYYKNFIREDGESGTVDDLLRHVHHFLELGGEDSLALGSDFDGCTVPDYLGDGIGKLDYLAEKLESSGIPAKVTDKILFGNANNYFMKLAGG